MGGKTTKQASGNLLEGTTWLRTVVQHYQKRRHGVGGYDSFTIEPLYTDYLDIEHFRVSIVFRNAKGKSKQVYWIVKVVQEGGDIDKLNHEIKVYTELLTEISKFLANKRNQRARYLLNVPDFIFHDRQHAQGGKMIRCHLVTEDVTETKRCNQLKSSQLISGLKLGQFKVLLGTLAQFHAVGIAWTLGSKDDSVLDLFPFLHKTDSDDVMKRQQHLNNYQRLLELHYDTDSRQVHLFKMLMAQADDLLNDNLKQDMCDVLGSICLGPIMANEVMFQYENSKFFDLCGVGGANNIIWNNIISDKGNELDEDSTHLSPICAAITTCHRVHFGHLLKELALYFFTLPESLIRERYIVFLLQSYCHVLTMTLEMLDVNWGRHFGADLTFTKMIVAFYRFIPQAILRAVIAHMELTDPDELEKLLSNKQDFVIQMTDKQSHLKYIPLTHERVHFLLSLMNRVHKPV